MLSYYHDLVISNFKVNKNNSKNMMYTPDYPTSFKDEN